MSDTGSSALENRAERYIAELFDRAPYQPQDSVALFQELRREAPVFRAQSRNLWLIARYSDCTQLLGASSAVRSAAVSDVVPRGTRRVPVEESPQGLFSTGPTVTALYRALAVRRRLAGLEPAMWSFARELAAQLVAQGSADWVAGFCVPYAATCIRELIGLPAGAWSRLFHASYYSLRPGEGGMCHRSAALRSLMPFYREEFRRQVQHDAVARAREPRDDALTSLVSLGSGPEAVDAALIERLERVATNAALTTADLIGSAMWCLLRGPEIRDRLRTEPHLLANAVEETLRLEPPVQGPLLTATEDLALAGRTIPRGDVMLLLFDSANRDEAHFSAPHHFDLERPNAADHLSFSFGPARCAGAPLARRACHIALATLLDLAPSARLAPEWTPRHASSRFNRGLESLVLNATVAASAA